MFGNHRGNLQFLVLGMMIANKELRESVVPSDFSDKTLQCVASELKHGKSHKYLRETLLEECGVDWDRKDGAPIVKALNRLRVDGCRERVMLSLEQALHDKDLRTLQQNEKFFHWLAEAGKEANRGETLVREEGTPENGTGGKGTARALVEGEPE